MFECIKENRKCNERTVKSIALFLVLSSYFITAIDGSIVITGLKRIAEDLQLSSVSLSWVQNAYVLVFGGFMLLGGRLGDTLGRKRMFNLSLMLFGFGSLGAGVAPSAGIMIAARFVQGVGAAVMAPAALALIMDYFEGEKRTKAVAWYGSISGIGLCFGLIIGGAVTTYLTWRDGFLIQNCLKRYLVDLLQKIFGRICGGITVHSIIRQILGCITFFHLTCVIPYIIYCLDTHVVLNGRKVLWTILPKTHCIFLLIPDCLIMSEKGCVIRGLETILTIKQFTQALQVFS